MPETPRHDDDCPYWWQRNEGYGCTCPVDDDDKPDEGGEG